MIYIERVAPSARINCLILLAGSACSDEKDEPREVSCRLNSDCAEGGVCVGSAVSHRAARVSRARALGSRPNSVSDVTHRLMCMELDAYRTQTVHSVCFQGQCLTDLDDRDHDGLPDREDNCPQSQTQVR